MNITKKNIDDLSVQVTMTVTPEDYEDNVKKALNDARRRAELKGFRKGMAPMSIIQKMYGRSTLLEQVNTLVSDSLNSFMESENIHIIGEPLASENQEQQDLETATDFVFSFDLMLAPVITIDVDQNMHLPLYIKPVEEQDKEQYIQGLMSQFGDMLDAPEVGAEDSLTVTLTQGETEIKDAYLNMKSIDAEEIKQFFMGKAVGEVINADVTAIFPEASKRAALLKVKEEELGQFENAVFDITIEKIKRFVPATEGQELYDKAFGENTVTTHEAFMEKVTEHVAQNNENESRFKFAQDTRRQLVEQADIHLPDTLLKRWLFEGNDGKYTQEQIDKEYPAFLEDFRWQLVREYIMKKYEIKVEKDDMVQSAVAMARYQFAMYGLNNVPDEHLVKYAESMLSDEKQARSLYERAEENKVIDFIRGHVTIDQQ